MAFFDNHLNFHLTFATSYAQCSRVGPRIMRIYVHCYVCDNSTFSYCSTKATCMKIHFHFPIVPQTCAVGGLYKAAGPSADCQGSVVYIHCFNHLVTLHFLIVPQVRSASRVSLMRSAGPYRAAGPSADYAGSVSVK